MTTWNLSEVRLSKESFRWLLNRVQDDLDQPNTRSNALNPFQPLSVALQFYASASFHLDVGDTVCVVFHRLIGVYLPL